MSARGELNPVAWLLWLLAIGAAPLTSRHPLYLALALLVVMVVHLSIPSNDGGQSPWRLFAYVGSTVAVLSIGFNVLTVHSGDRPFAELPENWPIIGGPLTYNALVYGIASALAISSLLFAAATFNTVVRHIELIRRIPRAFQQFGVAGAIALNYVPQTLQAGRDIYDAQRARGHQMRSVGDARAFFVPLLGNGLERAVQTSEALETRGYGSATSAGSGARLRAWRIAGAMVLLAAALPLLATGRLLAALLLTIAAVLVVTVGSRGGGRRVHLSGWDRRSIVVAASASVTLASVGAAIASGDALVYSPFPRLVWPEFEPLIGLVLCLQLLPALLVPGARR